ncbi:TMPIT-like protein-domain-containing protein [Chytridium lagenaria]|nr:TMPIT-like protein-domain-containing protein [Chytridium lagenaria]
MSTPTPPPPIITLNGGLEDERNELLVQGVKLMAELKELETRAANYNALAIQVFSEETACIKDLKEKRKAVQSFLKSLKALPVNGDVAVAQSPTSSSSKGMSFSTMVETIKRRLDRVEYQLPKPAKLILRLALGASAPTTLRPSPTVFNLKKKSNPSNSPMTVIGLGLSALCLSVDAQNYPRTAAAVDAAFLFTLIYYYSTVTLREHILVVNGSRIRFWWFLHHYLSIVMTGILIIWRSSSSFLLFRPQFLTFSAYLGAVQYLQYRYQRKRLYVLVAMDMAAPMDTVSGDGVHTDRIEREFLVLVPFLVFAQMWQVWNAWVLSGMWVLASSILFALLGAGNIITTMRTFVAKRRSTTPTSTLYRPSLSPFVTSATGGLAKRTLSAPMLAGMGGGWRGRGLRVLWRRWRGRG